MASVTALPERERAKKEREREREREELGFGNSTASALGGEDLRPGGGGWSLGGVFWEGGKTGPSLSPGRALGEGRGPEGSYRDRGGGGSYRTGALTGKNVWGIIFGGSTGKSCNSPGALQENPVIAPGQLHKKCLWNYFGNHFAAEGTVLLNKSPNMTCMQQV